mgnify:CR=1 FL=1
MEGSSTSSRVAGFAWLAAALLLVAYGCEREPAPAPATTAPAKVPATTQALATKPASRPATYFELVLRKYPAIPATQPLGVPLDYSDAGHLVFHEPVHLDRAGVLWITRDDVEPTPLVRRGGRAADVYLRHEAVVFVHWHPDQAGNYVPMPVYRDPASGRFVLIDGPVRRDLNLPAGCDWKSAFSWRHRIVVPTELGVSVIAVGGELRHLPSPPLAEPDQAHGPVQVTLDWRGVLAWMPPAGEHPGSRGIVRFLPDEQDAAGGRWQQLGPDEGWPQGLLQLKLQDDGTVLRIVKQEGDQVALSVVLLERRELDEQKILDLIDQLSDDDPDKRQQAHEKLAASGPSAWPLLEKAQADLLPEARLRVGDLLKNKVRPSLGVMSLVDGRMKLLGRYADCGALFRAEAGVSVPTEGDEPQIIAPALLFTRPGEPVQLLSAALARELEVPGASLSVAAGEWIVSDPRAGPRRFVGNGTVPLLRKGEEAFRHFVGVDRRGRWLFTEGADVAGRTLIIDPTLPDPLPRLPVWHMVVRRGMVGWNRAGWPVMQSGGAWALEGEAWRPVDEASDRVFNSVEDMPPATLPASQPADVAPLLVTPDNWRFFGGLIDLTAMLPDGRCLPWLLPPDLIGDSRYPVTLIRAAEDRLFLFNARGRVVRLRATPQGTAPFVVDAVFMKRIPDHADPQRIWLDPAGRIIMAYDYNKLAILFPEGHIPPAIAQLMPAQEEQE